MSCPLSAVWSNLATAIAAGAETRTMRASTFLALATARNEDADGEAKDSPCCEKFVSVVVRDPIRGTRALPDALQGATAQWHGWRLVLDVLSVCVCFLHDFSFATSVYLAGYEDRQCRFRPQPHLAENRCCFSD